MIDKSRPPSSKLDFEKLYTFLKEKCQRDALNKKTCILLIGMTGAGKTLTTHFLAGHKLEERDAPNGKGKLKKGRKPKTIIDVAESYDDLVVGHTGNSETKTLGLADCTVPTFFHLTIIDSAGLEDTAGDEHDIANYASLAQVMRECESVRPVLIINSQGVDAARGQRLKRLVDLVTQFFAPIKKHKGSITVLFTHCNPKDSEDVNKVETDRIDEALETVREDEHLEPDTQEFIEHLYANFDETFLLRPLTQDPATVLESIMKRSPLQLDDSKSFEVPLSKSIVARLEADTRELVANLTTDLADHKYSGVRNHLDRILTLATNLNHCVLLEEKAKALLAVKKHLDSMLAGTAESKKDKKYRDLGNLHTHLSEALTHVAKSSAEVQPAAATLENTLEDVSCFVNERSKFLLEQIESHDCVKESDGVALNELKGIKEHMGECLLDTNKKNYQNAVASVVNCFERNLTDVEKISDSVQQVLAPSNETTLPRLRFPELIQSLKSLGTVDVLESHDNEARNSIKSKHSCCKATLCQLLNNTNQIVEDGLLSLTHDLNQRERTTDNTMRSLRAGLCISQSWNSHSQEMARVLVSGTTLARNVCHQASQTEQPPPYSLSPGVPMAEYTEQVNKLHNWRQQLLNEIRTCFQEATFDATKTLIQSLDVVAGCDDVLLSPNKTRPLLEGESEHIQRQIKDRSNQAREEYNSLRSRDTVTPEDYDKVNNHLIWLRGCIDLEVYVLEMLPHKQSQRVHPITSDTFETMKADLKKEWVQRLTNFLQYVKRDLMQLDLSKESVLVGKCSTKLSALFTRLSSMGPVVGAAFEMDEKDSIDVYDAMDKLHERLYVESSDALSHRDSNSSKWYKLLSGVHSVVKNKIESSVFQKHSQPARISIAENHKKYSQLRRRYLNMLETPLPRLESDDGTADQIGIHLLWLQHSCKIDCILDKKATQAYKSACDNFKKDVLDTFNLAKQSKQKNLKDFMKHRKTLYDCRDFCKLHVPDVDVVDMYQSLPASDTNLGQNLKDEIRHNLEKRRVGKVKGTLSQLREQNDSDALHACETAVEEFIESCEAQCTDFEDNKDFSRKALITLKTIAEQLGSIDAEDWSSVDVTFDASDALEKCHKIILYTWNEHEKEALQPIGSTKSLAHASEALDVLYLMFGIFRDVELIKLKSHSAVINDMQIEEQYKHVVTTFKNRIVALPDILKDAIDQKNYSKVEFLLGLCAIDKPPEGFGSDFFTDSFSALKTLVRETVNGMVDNVRKQFRSSTNDTNEEDALQSLSDTQKLLQLKVVDDLCPEAARLCEKIEQSYHYRSKRARRNFFDAQVQHKVREELEQSVVEDYEKIFVPLVDKILEFVQREQKRALDMLASPSPSYTQVNTTIDKLRALNDTINPKNHKFSELDDLEGIVEAIEQQTETKVNKTLEAATASVKIGSDLEDTKQKLEEGVMKALPIFDIKIRKNYEKKCSELIKRVDQKREFFVHLENKVRKIDLFVPSPLDEVTEQLQELSDHKSNTGAENGYDVFDTKLQEAVTQMKQHWSDQEFKKIANCLKLLAHLKDHAKDRLQFDASDALSRIHDGLKQLCEEFEHSLSATFDKEDFKSLNKLLERAERAEEHLHKHYNSLPPLLEPIHKKFKAAIETTAKCDADFDCEVCAQTLIDLKLLVKDVSDMQVQADAKEAVSRLLKRGVKAQLDMLTISAILSDEDGGFGSEIVHEHEEFKHALLERFNKKTAGITLDHALESLEDNGSNAISSTEKELLQKYHEEYGTEFKQCIEKFDCATNKKQHVQVLVKDIRTTAQGATINLSSQSIKRVVPKLLAQLSVLMAIQNLQHSDTTTTISPVKLHVVQVLAIFRLMDLDVSQSRFLGAIKGLFKSGGRTSLPGHFAEVGTGQGKSMLLGLLSVILALLGFKVNCVCYSENLSKRDFESFESLFALLDLNDSIEYGTLSELAEDLCNPRGSIRDAALDIFNGRSLRQNRVKERKPRILLVDEVDVFFADDFYPSTYNPSSTFRHTSLSDIIRHIWKNRNACSIDQIKQLDAYNHLIDCIPRKMHGFVNQQLREMIRHSKNPEQYPYKVIDGRIGYKRQDSISFNTSYGYYTMFAYLLEADRKAIDDDVAERHLAIKISCGSFAYAELPKLFDGILGVSGTLSSLSEAEWALIREEYGVKKKTILPSLYGESQLEFKHDRDVVVEFDKQAYFQKILHEIQQHQDQGQPVIVFFASEKKIKEFQESGYGRDLECDVVTEATKNPHHYVTSAVRPKKVTLFARVFGRGSDFISHDATVNANRGVHVIQTFFSDELSEEIQIKGRTARQGEKGTYQMVLLAKDVQDLLDMKETELRESAKSSQCYDTLNTKREAKLEGKLRKMRKGAESSRHQHDMSQTFATAPTVENLLALQ